MPLAKVELLRRITESLNPRICKVVALGTPTEKENLNGIFKGTCSICPPLEKSFLFDRSWYNRAGVERVMGFCTNEEYKEFKFMSIFEQMLIRSDIAD